MYKMRLDLFVISDLSVELNCSWFCVSNTFHLKLNTTSFEVHLQNTAHITRLSIFRIRPSCSVHEILLGIKWASEHFFKSRLSCLEKRIWISYRHSRRSQSSASLRSATPSCSCRPLYLRFSRTDLLTMTSTFQKGFRSRLSLNCWPTFRF